MEKIVIRSTSNVATAHDDDVEPSWYTVLHGEIEAYPQTHINPWNKDDSELEKKVFLEDDCVIIIRPARYSLKKDGAGNHEKDRYFLEISNQDGSMTLSSCRVYDWTEVNKLAFYFRGLSFKAGLRVWKTKNL